MKKFFATGFVFLMVFVVLWLIENCFQADRFQREFDILSHVDQNNPKRSEVAVKKAVVDRLLQLRESDQHRFDEACRLAKKFGYKNEVASVLNLRQ